MTGARSLFVSEGGTVRPDAPSYIERRADEELFTALREGQLCYVLDSRQKGKSSLMNRMTERLRDARIATAVIDLQRLGTNVDPESWYYGMLLLLGESLQISDELIDAWNSTTDLSAFARWSRAIETVILPKFEKRVRGDQKLTDGGFIVTAAAERLVVFVDEVDIVRSLPFSTDEFFHGIRDMYNRRSTDSRFDRITFCLLGVAKPSELVRDARVTPFNVGRRIDLADFSLKEAVTLSKLFVNAGLASQVEAADSLIERVIYWTNGHPHLTQQVCAALEKEGGSKTKQDVDRIVSELYFQPQSLNDEPNLQDVSRRVLEIPPDGMDKEAYLFVLSERLEKLIRRGSLPANDDDPVLKTLRLAGLTRESAHSVKIRNRIYERVFSMPWLEASIPELGIRQTQRDQRRRWMLRTGAAGTIAVIFLVAYIQAYLSLKSQQDTVRETQVALDNEKRIVQDRMRIIAQLQEALNNREKAVVAAAAAAVPSASVSQISIVIDALRRGITSAASSVPPPKLTNPIARTLSGGQYPFTQKRRLRAAELQKYSKAELKLMRNEIFARHHLDFDDSNLDRFFAEKLPGYKGNRKSNEIRLSRIESDNVKVIRAVERNEAGAVLEGSNPEAVPIQQPFGVRALRAGEVYRMICIDSAQPANAACPVTELQPRKKGDHQAECTLHK